jgi:hypothetical protein
MFTYVLVFMMVLLKREWEPIFFFVRINFRGLIETAGYYMKCYAALFVNNRKYVNKIKNFCHKTDPAVSMRQRDPNFANDYLDFLGEYEAICKTAIGH